MIAVPVFRVYRIGREPSLGETFAIEAGPFAARPQTGAWPKRQARVPPLRGGDRRGGNSAAQAALTALPALKLRVFPAGNRSRILCRLIVSETSDAARP